MYSSEQLGENVKKARQLHSKNTGDNFTQQDLAVQIGETVKWVKQLERGEFYPSWDALNFIADVCRVDLDFLVGEDFAGEKEYEEAVKGGEVAMTIDDEKLKR
ncbi:MAG: helix-turn-helix transcriptional regulator [Desulfotomaculum sp.]|nr:helix-turn-helix transcriptional regulator [Desulfotomaculum sp.]